MWQIGKTIGDREGRMDICFAVAGISGGALQTLHIPEERLQEVGPLFSSHTRAGY